MSDEPTPQPQHYFSAEPQTASREQRIRADVRGVTLHLRTDAGMFSPAHVDRGSRELAKEMVLPPGGSILDWGAGYGFLGLLAARLDPSCHVTLIEINQRAAALAERNAQELGLSNVTVIAGSAPEDLGPERYDAIISNPPLRAGKPAVESLIAEALTRLKPSGELWIVVPTKKGAKGYLALMEKAFAEARTVAINGGFRVLCARQAPVFEPTEGNCSMSEPFDLSALRAAFVARYSQSGSPRIARAPGRLNLLGEHTDYNGGLVLPIALDRACYVAFAPRKGTVRVWAEAYGEGDEFDPATVERDPDRLWVNYCRGMAQALQQVGVPITGGDLVIAGDLPLGAGVSSSAAIETAYGLAFLALAERKMPARELALLCQRAENQFVGVNCGIMDQFAVGLCTAGHALLLDCSSQETRDVPLAAGSPVFFVLDTAKSRELAESGYNERRAQCESAARHFGVSTLREVTHEQIEQDKESLGDVVYRRCRHVLTENDRVRQALQVMAVGDWAAFGQLLDDSHFSLRDDYEVSCTELDVICALAREWPGCLGARMVGAGFGGCAMAAVSPEEAAGFAAYLAPCYQQATDREPRIFAVQPAGGAGLVEV